MATREAISVRGWFASTRFAGQRLRLALVGLLLAAPIAAGGCAARRNLPLTPLQLAIAPNVSVFAQETPVWGASINGLYGIQHEVKGIDVGPLNEVKELIGVGAGVVNVARTQVIGLQTGMGNSVEGPITGLQLGAANMIEGNLVGAQLGVGNIAHGGSGLQVGLLNVGTSLKGVQLGLLNFNEAGFLPFFPLFNFAF